MKKLTGAKTRLERKVQSILNSKVEKGYNIEAILKDLLYGGCQSGFIGELIYYSDTMKFYKSYKKEILTLLKSICDECGLSYDKLFGDKWDSEDIFADEEQNQNLLAWFGFEETARILAYRNDIEI